MVTDLKSKEASLSVCSGILLKWLIEGIKAEGYEETTHKNVTLFADTKSAIHTLRLELVYETNEKPASNSVVVK